MSEIPNDPMQAVAYARVVAAELAADAKATATSCQQHAMTQETVAKSLADLAVLLRGEGQAESHDVLMLLANALRGVGAGLVHAQERLEAHGAAWDREGEVWRRIMEPAAPAAPGVKP